MPRFGPDIAHHQSAVDLARAKPHVDFVFLKATDGQKDHHGAMFVDQTFAPRWRQLADLGVPRGAYHYARPNTPPEAQAAHFVSVARQNGFRAGDAAILDMEDLDASKGMSAAALRAWVDRFVGDVRQALPVREVVFYTGIPYWNDQMGHPPALPAGSIGWLSRYRKEGPYGGHLGRPAAWPDPPDIWQFTNGTDGRVRDIPGIGAVDCSEMTEECFGRVFDRTGTVSAQGGDWFDMATKDELAEIVRQEVKLLVQDIYPLLARGARAGGQPLPDHFPQSLAAIQQHLDEVQSDTKAIRDRVEHSA
jgi:GH25 family lysozyme M1 (1,4-beta-N-acetylmuramidase)